MSEVGNGQRSERDRDRRSDVRSREETDVRSHEWKGPWKV